MRLGPPDESLRNEQPDNPQRGTTDPHAQMDALRLWLAGGIHKFAVDPRRRLGSHGRARQVLTEDRQPVPASSGSWASLASTLDRHTVLGGMTELSPEERRVITLAYIEGLTNGEIATAQGVSVSTVRRLLERALKQLDAYLTRTGSWLSAILTLQPRGSDDRQMSLDRLTGRTGSHRRRPPAPWQQPP